MAKRPGRVTLVINVEEARRLQALWHGTSISQMVRILIREALDKEDKELVKRRHRAA